MTTGAVHLPGLRGRNPLGFLAALGLLDVLTRHDIPVRLSWVAGLRAEAFLVDAPDLDDIIATVDADRYGWQESRLLALTIDDAPANDLKPNLDTLRRWYGELAGFDQTADVLLLQGLLAEGATAGSGTEAKPTHLHFTAGQQRFLRMVRELRDGVGSDDIREALEGPWRFASALPSLGWDVRGQRIYALSGPNPAKDKRLSVPGAEWLAFLALTFFPVANHNGRLLTTGCARSWKNGNFSWPLWEVPLSARVVRSLISTDLTDISPSALAEWGVTNVLSARIRRSEQGGYGSFAPPTTVASGTSSASLIRPASGKR